MLRHIDRMGTLFSMMMKPCGHVLPAFWRDYFAKPASKNYCTVACPDSEQACLAVGLTISSHFDSSTMCASQSFESRRRTHPA
jgi:hypothetical protein